MRTSLRPITRGLWPALLGLAITPAAAEPATKPPVMTLAEALDYARAHQPQIRSALAEYRARQAEARVPRAQWLPQVGATAQLYVATANNTSASYLGVPELDLPRIGATSSVTQATAAWAPSASSLVAIGVGQEVYDFGRISAQTAAADAVASLARSNADAIDLDVQLGVTEAYDAVLAAKGVLKATEDAYKRALTHRDFAAAGTRTGLRPPIDLTRAQADVAQLEVRIIQATTGVQAARAGLAAAMASDALEVDAPDTAVDTTVDVSPPPSLMEALRTAAEHNPAIRAALMHLQAQQQAVHAITRELLPNVAATAGINARAGGARPSGGAAVPYGDGWLPDVPNWHVGLVLSWNIFDGTVLARRAAAKAREDAAAADLELQRMAVGLGAERAYLDLDAALQTLPRLRTSVDAAVANQAQAEARFKAGLGTIVELADAEALLTNAQLALAVGQFGVARARAQLGRVLGHSLLQAQR